MEIPTVTTTLATTTLFNALPTFSSSATNSLSLPLSTQSASLSSQALSSSVFLASSPSALPSISTSLSSQVLSTTTTLTPRLATTSAMQTSPSSFTPTPSPSNSASSDKSIAIPTIWIPVIVIFSLALIIFTFCLYKSRRRSQNFEAELALAPQNTPRPWSTMDVRPGLIRRTTTSRLREDWQQWIAKPPPLRGSLRRRDSAVLFGTGSGSRLSSEPLLTAHEVEVSGVLESADISDPPPAYTPRRF